MKPSEKLKRIKLISEQIFIQTIAEALKGKMTPADLCISGAEYFVTEFEKFEAQFLKDNSEVVGE